MTLAQAREARSQIEGDFLRKKLLISTYKVIDRIVILPSDEVTKSIYIGTIEVGDPNWKMNGFNEDKYYNGGLGIYRENDYRFQDDMILYAIVVSPEGKLLDNYEVVPLRVLQDLGEI